MKAVHDENESFLPFIFGRVMKHISVETILGKGPNKKAGYAQNSDDFEGQVSHHPGMPKQIADDGHPQDQRRDRVHVTEPFPEITLK